MKISVSIPVYNSPVEYLRRTIESVLAQEGDFELEVILSDDASEVDYGPLVQAYASAPITFAWNATNLGMVGNWNAAVRRSTGELVILLGHDDLLAPGMFAAYAEVLASDPEVVLCACARSFIDEDGSTAEPRRAVNDRANIFLREERYVLEGQDAIRLCLRNGNVIGEPSAVMYRRSVFDRLGGYDPAFGHAADVDFNLRASELGRIVYLRRPFLRRRLHQANLTRRNLATGELTVDRVRLFERFAIGRGFSAREIAEFRAHLVARSSFDLLRSTAHGRWPAAKLAARSVVRHVRPTPLVYGRYLYEIVSGRNRDAR
ncbi:MAG: glycosyltransferase [Gemmatimonadota bacterium]